MKIKIKKPNKNGTTMYGFVREKKADKIKIALFDTEDFICPNGNGCFWGHFIKDDWFDYEEIEIMP